MNRRVKEVIIQVPTKATETEANLAALSFYKKWGLIQSIDRMNMLETPTLIIDELHGLIRINLYYSECNSKPKTPVYTGTATVNVDGDDVSYEITQDSIRIILRT